MVNYFDLWFLLSNDSNFFCASAFEASQTP
jgi:hypothetical protein